MSDAKQIEVVAKALYYAEMCNEGRVRDVLSASPGRPWLKAERDRRRAFRDVARAAIKAMPPRSKKQ